MKERKKGGKEKTPSIEENKRSGIFGALQVPVLQSPPPHSTAKSFH
jgi:hypothetical protein